MLILFDSSQCVLFKYIIYIIISYTQLKILRFEVVYRKGKKQNVASKNGQKVHEKNNEY